MSMFRRGLMLAASQTKKENPIYGVKWVNDDTTMMQRTDDSTWLSYEKSITMARFRLISTMYFLGTKRKRKH